MYCGKVEISGINTNDIVVLSQEEMNQLMLLKELLVYLEKQLKLKKEFHQFMIIHLKKLILHFVLSHVFSRI